MLITGHRRVQLLQRYLHAAVAVDKPADVVHHGGLTEHAGALIRRPGENFFFRMYPSAPPQVSVDIVNFLPEAVPLQEHTKGKIILAVKLHGDDPVDNKTKGRSVVHRQMFAAEAERRTVPRADAGVGGVAGLS